MKPSMIRLFYLIFLLLLYPLIMSGQEKKTNYGNIPDELVAYDRYQKAYKYHFLEPMKFYGAGREKIPPADLKEVRIGFLGPLEGSIIATLGKQMLQGSMLAIEEANKKEVIKASRSNSWYIMMSDCGEQQQMRS